MTRPRRELVVAGLLLTAFLVIVAMSALPRLTMSFGPGYVGYNESVWGAGSRALREDGIGRSRLGTRRADGTVYADHPPLIVVEAATSEALFGEHRWSTRLPAAVSSLLAVVLVVGLLRELGVSPLAAVAATVLVFGSTMFAAYGMMLDTPIVGLPLGVAALWIVARGERARAGPLAGVLAALGVMTSWLGVLTALGATAVAFIRPETRRLGRALALGTTVGIVVLTAWLLWAYGSLAPVLHAARTRAGGASTVEASFADALVQTIDYWRLVYPMWLVPVALLGLVLTGRHRFAAPVAIVATGTVLLWTVVFHQGAYVHEYWTYWALVPLSIGVAFALEEARRRASAPLSVVAVACVVAVAVGGVSFAARRHPVVVSEEAANAGAAVEAARYPTGQRTAWYVNDRAVDLPFLSYLSRRPIAAVTTYTEIAGLAEQRPEDRVLVVADDRFRVVAARELPTLVESGAVAVRRSADGPSRRGD